MPLPQNFNVLLGAGVFGIVCAATLYVVEHYRQDRRRHAMAKDLARLNSELSVLRQELDGLMAIQKKKAAKKGKRRRVESVISSSTAEDYSSAVEVDGDSSDLEFYDFSDDDEAVGSSASLETDLPPIDKTLNEGSADELESCLEQLHNLCLEYPRNPQLIWRLAKAHYKLYKKTEKKDLIEKGIDACTAALNLNPDLFEGHKWLALLVGERCRFAPIKEKINDGTLFRQHLEAALKLDDSDPTLHHLLGRYWYDLSELKWYERKIATTFFAELPSGNFEQALNCFKEAERRNDTEWKENHLYVAKCMVKLGRSEEAVEVLKKADNIKEDNGKDDTVDAEVKELLKKYQR